MDQFSWGLLLTSWEPGIFGLFSGYILFDLSMINIQHCWWSLCLKISYCSFSDAEFS